MSRKQRILKKRYAIFCEGDAEYNYTEKMRKNQGVELVLKPINMHGGGYSNFLRQIKKEAQTNYLARFIIVDADRITTVSGEKENFLKLLEYCRIQNDKGRGNNRERSGRTVPISRPVKEHGRGRYYDAAV